MVDKKIVKEWLNKAQEDIGFASRNLADEENTFYAQICFHFHQAAEKYLKTYIVAYELVFGRYTIYQNCSEYVESTMSLLQN